MKTNLRDEQATNVTLSTDIIIIGSGVAGLCAASELVSRGAKVTVIDAHGGPGAHSCSWWAGGMLAPWCERESAEELISRLGSEAADWWEAQGVEVIRNGSLVVALGRDQSELKRFSRRTQNFKEIDGEKISKLEPDLEGQFSKGLYFESEAHLNPQKALEQLKANLQKLGVDFVEETIASITAFASENADKTILDCRGLAAQDVQPDLRGVKGEMVMLSCPELNLTRSIRLLHPRIPLYIVPRGDGIYMLGATMIESADRSRITVRSILELLNSAYAFNPLFGEAQILEIGVDSRPAFRDNLPHIRHTNNIISVNGLYRHGYLLAPALARMVSDYIFEQKQPEVMDEHSA